MKNTITGRAIVGLACFAALIGLTGNTTNSLSQQATTATAASTQNAPTNNPLFIIQGSTVDVVDRSSQRIVKTIDVAPIQPKKSLWAVEVGATGKSVYTIEGPSNENVIGPTQVFQIDIETKARKTICAGDNFVRLLISPNEQYILIMQWMDRRDEFPALWATIDLQNGTCTRLYTDPNEDLVLPILSPKWISNDSYLALALGSKLYSVAMPSEIATLILDTWGLADYTVIPGTRLALVAGHPKSQDTPDTYFATVDLDTHKVVQLPYHWAGGIGRASLTASPDGRNFVMCAQGCRVLEIATGKVVLESGGDNKMMWMK